VLGFLLRYPAELRAWITRTAAEFKGDTCNVAQTEGFCLGHSKAR